MKAKGIMKKIFTLVLTLVMILNLTNSAFRVEASGQTTTVTKVIDGVEYKINTFVEDGTNHVEVFVGDNNNHYELYMSDDNEKIIREEYDDKASGVKRVYDASIQLGDSQSTGDDKKDIAVKGINWNSKTYEHLENDYWYKKGNNGSKVYYRIGCKAEYQIRVDNNKKHKQILEKYASKIKNCNKHYALALAASAATGVGVGTVLALVTANAIFPPSIIVDVVIGILGGGAVASLVKYTVDAYCDYNDIKDIYIDARACGKKVS